MASHVVVIDTSFRRVTIKVTPGKYLTDVLEEACGKFGIKSSNYGLKHNNKPIDISRTFRQTGLSSGAKLELVVASRTPSVVSVALQLPESLASSVQGGRLTDKYPSDTTLWLILRKFESSGGVNLNFTARGVTQLDNGTSGAGRIFYEMPLLNIMGRELSTFGDLQKTLAQLGLNGGSALIRIDFRKTDQPLEAAMAEIEQYFKEEGKPVTVKDEDAAVAETTTVTDAIAKLPSPDPPSNQELEEDVSTVTPSKRPAPLSQEESVLGPDQRPISVYSAPSNETPKAALMPVNDDDYEPTIAHAKLHQSRLQTNSHNKRLLSDAEIERLENEKAAKLASTKEVSIKIRFPDQSSIVSTFNAQETCAQLYSFVTGVIVADDQPFKLVWTDKGPQSVPRDDKKTLIKGLGFEGRMLINFHWEDGASEKARKSAVLKLQYAQSAKEVPVPEPPAAPEENDEKPKPVEDVKGKAVDSSGGGKKGMPKWFKGIGGKK